MQSKERAGTARGVPEGPKTGDKGLKSGAIGFVDALVFGLATTAPAYSLAAVIGLVVVTVGVQAPAVLLASFVPMFFIAAAFYHMNRVDQDCGTTFSWATRALGPWAGWMGGWAICVSGVLVIGSLADVASRYTYLLLGFEGAAGSKAAVTALALVFIGVMTAICVYGIEPSARLQNTMIVMQVTALVVFAGVALFRVFSGSAPEGSTVPELAWFSPFAIDNGGALISGLLIGVFIYWGWESAVNLTEETTDGRTASGRAALLSTVILLATYLSVAVAVVAFAGVGTASEFADDDAILSTVAGGVLGTTLGKVVVFAVLVSALASTQTTVIPASRTSLSMAKAGAMPGLFGRVHPRFLTPHASTIAIGLLAAVWYGVVNSISENFLFDTLSALSLMVAFYYSLTGFACVIYYRRELFKSAKNLLFIGVAPLLGASLLSYLFVRSLLVLADPGESYTGGSLFGFGLPMVIGVGFLLLGVAFMVLWRIFGESRGFFGRRPGTVHPEVAEGKVRVEETVGAPAEEGRV
ncbi:Amino acid permease (plasmid) [Rubrobacter radiotolerans]|uniref:APC family permease n=1 Tax=Rubrobacter radiotolerans TaxID=42256 RepID=A0A023X7Q8_RUBRA|nr:APC family permease [Rubrobacter radiotolerans]AHY48251.1 Amino acid permease [Rubrobacter radiotolerans]MDX5895524.1 APC family permease [Rubrobacter radiotolerans]SMC01449.1 Amino acid transporter [Rubrobacter radiotolerans DSM 5868]